MALEVCVVESATVDTSVNVKALGVVSAAKVVAVYTSVTPPILRVQLVAVEKDPEEVCLTANVFPFTAVVLALVYAPPFLL
jgi:hypothetical protein